MCPICGYSDIVKGKVITPTSLKKHKNYRQFDCSCEELTQVRLGHRFQTDVARFTIPMLGSFTKEDYAIALSFMYAFLEGTALIVTIQKKSKTEKLSITGFVPVVKRLFWMKKCYFFELSVICSNIPILSIKSFSTGERVSSRRFLYLSYSA